MVHLDMKKVGVIPDGGGWRVHGKGSDHAKRVERAKNSGARTGYTYLHTAIDGFSRLAYTETLPEEKARTAIGFTHRARAFFAAHGITRLHRIVTDNSGLRTDQPAPLPNVAARFALTGDSGSIFAVDHLRTRTAAT